MEGNSMGTGANISSAVNSAEVGQPQTTGDAEVNATANNVPDAGGQEGAGNAEAVTLEAIFEKYPELKKEADKRTQNAVQKRAHQINKSMQGKNDIIDKLMVAHGAKNIEELKVKLDDSLAEEFSIKNGVDNDIGREMLRLRTIERRNAEARAYYESREKAEQQLNAWENEAEEVRKIYPDMDLTAELENPRFVSYLTEHKLPMKTVYEAIHHDEIVEAAEKRAAAAYAQSVNNNMSRPVENGVGNQSAVSSKSDVSKLTKKERAALAERAMRGEKISF